MTGLESQPTVHRKTQLQQTLKSEENVKSLQNVFESEYFNSFGFNGRM